ncbi:MAG: PAS domain S-box protein, partial [Actinomycetota bacterium]
CGASIAMLVPATGLAQAEEILAPLFQGETRTGEFMVQRRDGVCFPALVTNTPIYDEAGKLTAVLGVSSDISERKAAETALRESEARFRAIFDQAAIGMARVDMQGGILEANSALERMLGYNSEELRDQSIAEITHPDDLAEDHRLYLEMMEGRRECYQLEKRFRHKDGRDVWGRLTASLVRGAEGQPLFGIGMVEDISERKALQEQFRQAQRMEAVGQLAGGVAHDFNNMLAVITGYSELMLGSLDPGSPLRAYVDEISKAGERAAGLTKQLLAFSRKQLLESRVFDLNATVHRMDKMLRRLIGEDIELVTLTGVRPLKIKADPSQIEQVVMNLAINGRDAMPVGGLLSIHTANVRMEVADPHHPELQPGEYVSLQIRDTGCGIDPEVLPRIFEPFFTTKEVGKGPGLGLATVYGIVRQSGGSITVESEPGQGATFTVLLPAAPSDAQKADERQSMALPQGTETILLTEDDPMVRGMVQILLTQCGYQVLEAMQGEEALRIAEAHEGPIHLLLTDVVMPIMSGRELAQALREVRPETPVLYMSGYTDDAMLRHGVTDAGVELIQKPFSPLTLMERIRRLLDAAWARPSRGTVLIVDDDAVERESLGEILREEGYEVAEAGDGQAAFALLRDGLRPSAILLDLMMPGMNGWVFRLEQRHSPELAEIPVVVISGEFDPKGVEAYLQPAATLPKPLDIRGLLTVLAQLSAAED